MAVINFAPVSEKHRKLANYFADQEREDFKEAFQVLKENTAISFLFKECDLDKFCSEILEQIDEKYYRNRKLTPEAVRDINELYSARFDIDDFYEEFLKDES